MERVYRLSGACRRGIKVSRTVPWVREMFFLKENIKNNHLLQISTDGNVPDPFTRRSLHTF